MATARVGYEIGNLVGIVARQIVEEGRAARLIRARIGREYRIAVAGKTDHRKSEILRRADRNTERGRTSCSASEIEVLHLGAVVSQIKMVKNVIRDRPIMLNTHVIGNKSLIPDALVYKVSRKARETALRARQLAIN